MSRGNRKHSSALREWFAGAWIDFVDVSISGQIRTGNAKSFRAPRAVTLPGFAVEMTPNLMEWAAKQDFVDNTHDFQAILQGFGWDPSANQGALFGCDAYDGGFNAIKYCSEEIDRLDDRQLRELDREKRRELLIEQSNVVWNDLPILIYRFGVERPGYSVRLHNFFPTGNGGVYWSLPFVWIEA